MFSFMDLPDLLRFDPVPARRQHNGWTPVLQRRFILALARGEGPDRAARALGRSRQFVYRLRKRADAASFAAAWDRAQDFACRAQTALRSPGASVGIDTFLVPRFYRGRLIGFVQREDIAGAMRALGSLDRIADELAGPDGPGCRRNAGDRTGPGARK